MTERKRIEDLNELGAAALEALTMALSDGDAQHPPGSWREEKFVERIARTRNHLVDMINANNFEEERKELTHAICDLVIIYANRNYMPRKGHP